MKDHLLLFMFGSQTSLTVDPLIIQMKTLILCFFCWCLFFSHSFRSCTLPGLAKFKLFEGSKFNPSQKSNFPQRKSPSQRQHESKWYNNKIRRCILDFNISGAEYYYERTRVDNQKDYTIEEKTYNMLICAYGRSKSPKKAYEIYLAGKVGGRVPVYNAMISVFGRAGHWREALKCLQDMDGEGVHPDVVSFNAAIDACGRAGRWQQALQLLDLMKRKGLSPNINTYNAAMTACEMAVRPAEALQLLKDMSKQQVDPNSKTYSSAMSACGKAGNLEETKNIYATMTGRGISPNVYTYNSLVLSYSNRGEWEAAVNLLDDMKQDVVPSTVVYNSVISACGKSGRVKEALRVLDMMDSDGVRPNSVSYNAAISACVAGKKWQEALELRNRMKTTGVKPDGITYSTLIAVCGKAKQWEKVLELFDVVDSLEIDGGCNNSNDAGSLYSSREGVTEIIYSTVIESLLMANQTSRIPEIIAKGFSRGYWGSVDKSIIQSQRPAAKTLDLRRCSLTVSELLVRASLGLSPTQSIQPARLTPLPASSPVPMPVVVIAGRMGRRGVMKEAVEDFVRFELGLEVRAATLYTDENNAFEIVASTTI